MPPIIPPTCMSVMAIISTHSQTTQDTPSRGPGTRLKASNVVSPVPIA